MLPAVFLLVGFRRSVALAVWISLLQFGGKPSGFSLGFVVGCPWMDVGLHIASCSRRGAF